MMDFDAECSVECCVFQCLTQKRVSVDVKPYFVAATAVRGLNKHNPLLAVVSYLFIRSQEWCRLSPLTLSQMFNYSFKGIVRQFIIVLLLRDGELVKDWSKAM